MSQSTVTAGGTSGGGGDETDPVAGPALATHAALTAAHGATGAVVGTTNTQTLTGKTISGSDNTITNLNAGNLSTGTVGTARLGTGTADNTKFLRGDGTWATPAGGGSGTVTSVALSLPSELTVSGSPVTTTGTLSAAWAAQSAGKVLASPASGGSAAPSFRALAATDIPSLAASKITSGTFDAARLGTGTADETTFLRGDGVWDVPSGGGGGTVPRLDEVLEAGANASGIDVTLADVSAGDVVVNFLGAGNAEVSGVLTSGTFRVGTPSVYAEGVSGSIKGTNGSVATVTGGLVTTITAPTASAAGGTATVPYTDETGALKQMIFENGQFLRTEDFTG